MLDLVQVGANVLAATATSVTARLLGVIDPTFTTMMPTVVVWRQFTGEDQWGNNTYRDMISLSVRAEPVTSTMSVTTQQGGTMTADIGLSTMLIADLTEPVIGARDLIVFPDARQIVVVSSVVQYDEKGPYYQEVQCENNKEQ